MLKKIIKIFLITIAVLLLIAFTAPFLFKTQLVNLAKKELNKKITGRADFSSLDISLLKNFPKLSISIHGLHIMADSMFAGKEVMYVETAAFTTNFKTLWKDNVEIYGIRLDGPTLHLLVDSAGKENYNIFKKYAAVSTDTSVVHYNISSYQINNGALDYMDQRSRLIIKARNISHSGSGDFIATKFSLQTNTRADSVSIGFKGINYLLDAAVNAPANITVDNAASTYAFAGTQPMEINDLPINISGDVTLLNDSATSLNINFDAPTADFKKLLLLVPGAYASNIKNLDAGGKASLKGTVKGISSPSSIPGFDIRMKIENGNLSNKQFPQSIKNVYLDAAVTNTGTVVDSVQIALSNGRAVIGSQPLAFALTIVRPLTDMYMQLNAKGVADLAQISSILSLKNMTLKGIVDADIKAAGKMADMQAGSVSNVQASGFAKASNLFIKTAGMQWPLNIGSGSVQFNNYSAVINLDGVNINNTKLHGDGNLVNFIPYLFLKAPLAGNFNISSNAINLKDWSGSSTATAGDKKPAAKSAPFEVPADMQLSINATVGQVVSEKLTLNNVKGKMLVQNKQLIFENVQADALDGSMLLNGSYSSLHTPAQPDISLNYKIIKADTRKTFEAINTSRALMPVIKYLSGKFSSDFKVQGKLGDDLFPVLNSLNGFGSLKMDEGVLNNFEPLQKIAASLGIEKLQNIAVKEISNKFSFANGRVTVLPFSFTLFGKYNFEVSGSHGFDNTMDYGVVLQVPRQDLGKAGLTYVTKLTSILNNKTGLNVKESDKVKFFIKLNGLLNNPGIKIQLAETAKEEVTMLKKQVEDQVKSRIDSTKKLLQDTAKNFIKNTIMNKINDGFLKKENGVKDSGTNKNIPQKPSLKDQLFKTILGKKKKDSL